MFARWLRGAGPSAPRGAARPSARGPAAQIAPLRWRAAAADAFAEMPRTCVIALLAAACLLASACSGSSSPRGTAALSPAATAAADSICARQLAQLDRLTRPTTADQAVSYLPQALRIMRVEIRRLEALDPPSPGRAQFAAGLASERALTALLGRFLHQLQTGFVEFSALARVQTQSWQLRAAVDSHFRQAGAQLCAH